MYTYQKLKGGDLMKNCFPEPIYFTLPKLKCKKCGHEWYPRKSGVIKDCPSCRKWTWNNSKKVEVKLEPATCPNEKCKHVWQPFTPHVKECPKCKKKVFKKER